MEREDRESGRERLGRRLPRRMLPALRRWVTAASLGADQEAVISRRTGGRV
ncbi:MAG: hypothetical protein M3024_02390 [Candidatus Dormibacteraeota bacterium]|nr:hypothetical protein [Candidatus Dormibacteraeota bacterium]